MSIFKFKHFQVQQIPSVHAVGTDAMILGALVEANNPSSILDIGTGTGVLSLMMAQVYPSATIKAIDVNEEAFQLAKQNFEQSPFSDRLKIEHQELSAYVERNTAQFNLIISNPPYFENSTPAKGEGRHRARHQSSLSVEDLLRGVEQLLTDDGKCWLILPIDQSERVVNEGDLFCTKRIKVFGKSGKHVRDVICLQKEKRDCKEDVLIIRDDKGGYTEAYKSLTREFHGVAL